jgi:hypothetical protein
MYTQGRHHHFTMQQLVSNQVEICILLLSNKKFRQRQKGFWGRSYFASPYNKFSFFFFFLVLTALACMKHDDFQVGLVAGP